MNSLKYFIVWPLIVGLLGCSDLKKKSEFKLQNGDLLFQDLDNDSLSQAIEQVTETGNEKELSFSHVGMVVIDKNQNIRVLEAIPKGLCETPLDSFLLRSLTADGKPKVVAGRLKNKFAERIPDAIKFGKSLIGYPYDNIYVVGDSAYYCSELLYEMMINSGDSSEVFKLNPMTFKDPKTGEFLPVWVNHYRNIGVPIPEGKLGLNPNQMSKSENIDIIHNYAKSKKKYLK